MITKKELTNRFSTIKINSNEIELMTSHTVYEKDDEKKDVLYPDYSGSTTHGYLGTVTFDKKNKKCYHSYLSIIDGKDVVTEVGDMQELFKAIEGFVAHVMVIGVVFIHRLWTRIQPIFSNRWLLKMLSNYGEHEFM